MLGVVAGGDLVLTVGLPLVAGLSVQQFAGVIAHELGHFTQGTGMRLSYVVRSVNSWLARVVYERDDWDESLVRGCEEGNRLSIFLLLAIFCVWLTRRVLWLLMVTGHALSCFMLRQMEYDADRYETRWPGQRHSWSLRAGSCCWIWRPTAPMRLQTSPGTRRRGCRTT